MSEVFHSGELAVQKIAGVTAIADKVGKAAIRDFIAPSSKAFIEEQSLVVLATRDQDGYVWASLLLAEKGFIQVPSAQLIAIDFTKIKSSKLDICYQNIEQSPAIGSLYIALETRRRFRANGTIRLSEDCMYINVKEAYGNCPKYLQSRITPILDSVAPHTTCIKGTTILSSIERLLIGQADTFFLASQSAAGKLDASHRGGHKGFVEILEDGSLKIPDYPGNMMYNTLGNVQENSKMGLLFIDFEKGASLQLIGNGALMFNQKSDDAHEKTGGTGNYWLFKPEKWVRNPNHHTGSWTYIDASPFNP